MSVVNIVGVDDPLETCTFVAFAFGFLQCERTQKVLHSMVKIITTKDEHRYMVLFRFFLDLEMFDHEFYFKSFLLEFPMLFSVPKFT